MQIYSPKSIIFPEGNARGDYGTRGCSLTGKRQRHSERITCCGCGFQMSETMFQICFPAVFYMYVFSWFHSV
jgi:hypothetical protein